MRLSEVCLVGEKGRLKGRVGRDEEGRHEHEDGGE